MVGHAPWNEDLPLVRLNRMGASLIGAMDGRLSISALSRSVRQMGLWHQPGNRPMVSRTMVLTPLFAVLFRKRSRQAGTASTPSGTCSSRRCANNGMKTWPSKARSTSRSFIIKAFKAITAISKSWKPRCPIFSGNLATRYTASLMANCSPRPSDSWDGGVRNHSGSWRWGAGLGYLSQEMAKEFSRVERRGVEYIFLDLTRAFLQSQFALAGKARMGRQNPERERGAVTPRRVQRGPGHRQ